MFLKALLLGCCFQRPPRTGKVNGVFFNLSPRAARCLEGAPLSRLNQFIGRRMWKMLKLMWKKFTVWHSHLYKNLIFTSPDTYFFPSRHIVQSQKDLLLMVKLLQSRRILFRAWGNKLKRGASFQKTRRAALFLSIMERIV